MTRNVYKTAQGKLIDMGKLLLQNENVKAVGNMNVNAKGDLLDSNNRVIDTKAKRANRQYQRQTTNVTEQMPVTSARAAKKAKEAVPSVKSSEPIVVTEPPAVEIEPLNDTVDAPVPRGGLAAAISKARSSKKSK